MDEKDEVSMEMGVHMHTPLTITVYTPGIDRARSGVHGMFTSNSLGQGRSFASPARECFPLSYCCKGDANQCVKVITCLCVQVCKRALDP